MNCIEAEKLHSICDHKRFHAVRVINYKTTTTRWTMWTRWDAGRVSDQQFRGFYFLFGY